MQDLHFRRISVRGFWLNQWLESLPDDEARRAALRQVSGPLVLPSHYCCLQANEILRGAMVVEACCHPAAGCPADCGVSPLVPYLWVPIGSIGYP